MRLLNVHSLEFREFHSNVPPYVVTSHRWGTHEASYKDILKRRNQDSDGYKKIVGFCSFARQACRDENGSPIQWIWIDTCCINQSSSAEVSESINSMWDWYSRSAHAIAYLADVRSFHTDAGAHGVMFDLRRSQWFERGWTLQELLAPRCLMFVTRDWEVIGRISPENHACTIALSTPLSRIITEVTGIPPDVLNGFEGRRDAIPKETKMSWAANRRTTKAEDMAYCLLGIFDVHLPLIYGEGERNARKRLDSEIRIKEREERKEHSRDRSSNSVEYSNDFTYEKLLENGMCPVCKQALFEPVTTTCMHTFCETCFRKHSAHDLILLVEPLDQTIPQSPQVHGESALENFESTQPCLICGKHARAQRSMSLAYQLQSLHPMKHSEQVANTYGTGKGIETITITMGNWHEYIDVRAHRWTFFVKPSRTDIIKEVHIQLHETFKNRDNYFTKPPFTIHSRGWGWFTIRTSILLESGYTWVCDDAKDGPDGTSKASLELKWALDFRSYGTRGSMGRCRVQIKNQKGHLSGSSG